MNTKLTLNINQSVIKKAKLYAQKKGRSLSDIIENYLKIITSGEKVKEHDSPTVKALRGSFKDPSSKDYKSQLQEQLSKKYME